MRWGIADVVRWLNELDPAVLDWWEAFDRVDRISSEWEHTGAIAAEVHDVVRWLAAQAGVELPATLPADYAPRLVPVDRTSDPADSYDALSAAMNRSMRM